MRSSFSSLEEPLGDEGHGDDAGGEDLGADLQAEREASRELVNEARALREEALDVNSARLINDLEKIQIELANMTPDDASPGVAMLRQGIESKNLLFKLRIAETLYQQVKYAE